MVWFMVELDVICIFVGYANYEPHKEMVLIT